MKKLEEESHINREEFHIHTFRETLLKGDLDNALLQLDSILTDPSTKPVLNWLLYRKRNITFMPRSIWSCLKKDQWRAH